MASPFTGQSAAAETSFTVSLVFRTPAVTITVSPGLKVLEFSPRIISSPLADLAFILLPGEATVIEKEGWGFGP